MTTTFDYTEWETGVRERSLELQEVGKQILAGFYHAESKGRIEGDNATNIINSMLALGFMTAISTQSTQFNVQQTLIADCQRTVDGTKDGDAVDLTNTSTCLQCKALLREYVEDRAKLEQEAGGDGIPPTTEAFRAVQTRLLGPVKSEAGATLDDQFELTQGMCRYVCYQCVVEDTSQDVYVQIDSEADVTTVTFRNHYQEGLKEAASYQLAKYKNQVSELGYDIRENTDNLESLSLSVANVLSSITSVDTFNFMRTSALVMQNMRLGSERSTSMISSNIRQTVNLKMMSVASSQLYSESFLRTLLDVDDVSQAFQLEDTFTETLERFVSVISDLQGLLRTSIGKIMVSVIALLGAVLVMMVLFFFVRPVTKTLPGSRGSAFDASMASNPDV